MALISNGVVVAGSLLAGVGYIWFLIASIRISVLWFLACLLLPPIAQPLFLLTNFRMAVHPSKLFFPGIVLMLIGLLTMPR
jgi:hypothetical protein